MRRTSTRQPCANLGVHERRQHTAGVGVRRTQHLELTLVPCVQLVRELGTQRGRQRAVAQQVPCLGAVGARQRKARHAVPRTQRQPLLDTQAHPVRLDLDTLERREIGPQNVYTMRVAVQQEKEVRRMLRLGPAREQSARRLVGVPLAGDERAGRRDAVRRSQCKKVERAQRLVHGVLLHHQHPRGAAADVRDLRRIRDEALDERARLPGRELHAPVHEAVGRRTHAERAARQAEREARAGHHRIDRAL